MPRIRRWFHVSHDINSDPEVWELTDRFGERAYRVWIEILSIADRYDGYVPGENNYLCSTLAAKNKVKTKTVSGILEYVTNRQWIVYDPHRRVRNHLKYRPTRGDKQIPEGKQSASPPLLHTPTHSFPKDKDPPLEAPPRGAMNGFETFWQAYPQKQGRDKAEESWRKKTKGVPIEAILEGIGKWAGSQKWAEGFIPLPATWLNQGRWKDEPEPARQISSSAHKTALAAKRLIERKEGEREGG